MSYTTEVTQDCVGIVHSGRGVVTTADLLAGSVTATHLVQNTANFQYEFVDLTEMTELRFKSEDLDRIVCQDAIAARARPHAIVVIVAPQEEAHEMATTWEARVRHLGWTIHISRDRKSALQWLGHHIRTERPELLAQRRENVA